jgi:hypothetical protein
MYTCHSIPLQKLTGYGYKKTIWGIVYTLSPKKLLILVIISSMFFFFCIRRRRSLLLPPIQPRRAINTPLRLLTNVLAAVSAAHLSLNDVVMRDPRVRAGNEEQRQRNDGEAHQFVDERAPCPNNRAVLKCLLDRVVVPCVRLALAEDEELFFDVAGEEGEEGDDG